MEALTECYSYDNLFRHFTYFLEFFPDTLMEAVTDCYPYDNLSRHCVKYAGFFLGTPMGSITDCYLYLVFSDFATRLRASLWGSFLKTVRGLLPDSL